MSNNQTDLMLMNEVKEFVQNVKNFHTRYEDEELKRLYINYLYSHDNGSSFVYFFRNNTDGLVKIGCSSDVKTRLSSIKSTVKNYSGKKCIFTLEGLICLPQSLMKSYESQIHDELREYRKHGEWFDISYDYILCQYFPCGNFINKVAIDFLSLMDVNDYVTGSAFNKLYCDIKHTTDNDIYRRLMHHYGHHSINLFQFMSAICNEYLNLVFWYTFECEYIYDECDITTYFTDYEFIQKLTKNINTKLCID